MRYNPDEVLVHCNPFNVLQCFILYTVTLNVYDIIIVFHVFMFSGGEPSQTSDLLWLL